MEHGGRISYMVIARRTPVFSADGHRVGAVREGDRFVDAPEVAEIYERGVVLSLNRDETRELPRPRRRWF